MKLNGKVVLVTGGAVRIGAAICRALAARGAGVVIHCRNSRDDAADLQRELRRGGARAWILKADLVSEKACDGLVRRAIQVAGRLDILVNNAAVFHKDSIRTVDSGKLLQEFWPNLFAPMLLMRSFASRVRKGKIINLLDRRIASLDASCVPYVLSKKALAELTKIAALDLAPRITVNGVAPGAILPPPGKGIKYLHDKAGPVPLKRQVKPEEVAQAVVALLENDAITGQILFVDGGQNLLGNVE